MKALPPLDRVLVAVGVPLWLVCFGLHVESAVDRSLAWPWVWVAHAAGPDDPPIVIGAWPQFEASARDLEAGDRVLSLGGEPALGFGPVDFAVRALAAAAPDGRVELVVERDGRTMSTAFWLAPSPAPWVFGLISLSFAAVGTIVLLRAPTSRAARPTFFAGMAYGFYFAFFYGPDPLLTRISLSLLFVSNALAGPLALRAMAALPDEGPQRPLPRWPFVFVANSVVHASLILGWPLPPRIAQPLFPAANLVFGICLAWVVVRAYRGASPIGRRQLKWVMYGVYLAILPFMLAWLAYLLEPRALGVMLQTLAAGVLIPVGLLVAIVRTNLFDIDRLISATASYSLLTAALLATALTVVPPASAATSAALGLDATAGSLLFSSALAGVAIVLHRRLRPQIDRVFFAERYAIDRRAPALIAELGHCSDARALAERAGAGLLEIFQAEGCAIYSRTPAGYVARFARGRTPAPDVPLASPIVALLSRHRSAVLPLEPEPPELRTLAPAERATLDSLFAAVLLAFRVDGTLAGFACLGPKRSHDIYTPTDLAWLAALCERLVLELRSQDYAALIEEAHAHQRSLRRYVPGAIAEELESGHDLGSGEREVSVLFVDIRGYTAFSERRAPEEVFSMINQYTRAVSQIVRAHGGSVVEFNGDGMMAVFGAPRPIPGKERAAVASGMEIVKAVAALPADADGTPVGVGVGIATGPAYVGNIRSEDRLIWSAIGNTTNTAARLQSLTRDLGAAIVIDAATRARATELAHDFAEHRDVFLRGRSDALTLYARGT